MKRLIATTVCDIRLQVRNGFYYAAAFVATFWALALSRIPAHLLTPWMPVFVLSNILINTFYFMAGLVLLEKAEGTLMAQSVTPLRSWEYLVSKVITLTVVSVCESFVIVLFGYGAAFTPVAFLLGVVASAILFALAGFLLVIRYDSINEFLFPSFLFTLLFVPPFLSYLGLIGSALVYLHPIQGPLLLTQAAFGSIVGWQWLYSILYSILWIGVVLVFSQRAFERFVIAAERGMNR
jgi:fluoroquinolone transport system permease protein